MDDAEAEALIGHMIERTHASDQLALVDQFTRNGEADADTVRRAATSMGVPVEQYEAMQSRVLEGFQAQADATVEAFGVDARAVYDWARENADGDLQRAMRRHATERRTDGYGDIAKAYIANLGSIDPEALLNAELGDGVTVERDHAGRIVVRANGASYEWESAVRAGIVRVSRKR